MASPPPAGIYVPVPTFFAAQSAANYDATTPPIDVDTQAAHAVYLARAGIRGLVILGSTGESVHVHPRDRHAILSGTKAALDKAGFKDYPLVAGTATHSVEETLEQLRDAADAGAQWGLVLVPGYNAPVTTQEGIVRWFTAVADGSPIPIMIYHYPGVSNGVQVHTATYVTLARHPNIVGCKLSHADVAQHGLIASNPAIDRAGFRAFTGLGQHLLPVMSVGIEGAIDGTANFFPRSLVRLYELAAKNQPSDDQVRERRALQFKFSSVEAMVIKFGVPGIKECTTRLRGFGGLEGSRLPLYGGIPGGDAEWTKWKGELDALEEVEKAL